MRTRGCRTDRHGRPKFWIGGFSTHAPGDFACTHWAIFHARVHRWILDTRDFARMTAPRDFSHARPLPTYRHLPLLSPLHADRVPVDGDDHPLHQRHVTPAAHIVLQNHRKIRQPPLRLADPRQDVGAGPLEVEGSPVERHVVRVARDHQPPVTGGVTPQHPVFYSTLLVGAAEDLLALHHPVGFATAPLPARGVEILALLVVAVPVLATALARRHAFVAAEDEAPVAEATFGARHRRAALGGDGADPARGRAAAAAELVVRMRGAGGTCEKQRRRKIREPRLDLRLEASG